MYDSPECSGTPSISSLFTDPFQCIDQVTSNNDDFYADDTEVFPYSASSVCMSGTFSAPDNSILSYSYANSSVDTTYPGNYCPPKGPFEMASGTPAGICLPVIVNYTNTPTGEPFLSEFYACDPKGGLGFWLYSDSECKVNDVAGGAAFGGCYSDSSAVGQVEECTALSYVEPPGAPSPAFAAGAGASSPSLRHNNVNEARLSAAVARNIKKAAGRVIAAAPKKMP